MSDESMPSIASYTICERIGEGGMGTVYLAKCSEPVERTVALKVIRAGMDSASVVRRFEEERRVMARMSHDVIARVLDAGFTDGGQPYIAMEYVEGVPLTVSCDNARLPLVERIKLFQRVCDGVHHAHQQGVIHRDLKPDNVLMRRAEDGESVVKIIDFGIAYALDREEVGDVPQTLAGVLLGTPEYMAPEQARADASSITTATDVYSLGVMLYELLSGELPLDFEGLRSRGLIDLASAIESGERKAPSRRLSLIADPQGPAARKATPRELVRSLRGELDWIVMKAIAIEAERRYPSALALRQDLDRYLKHEPVDAGPPSTIYRWKRLARRHRLGLGILATALIAILLGAGFAFAFALRAGEARAATEERVAEFDLLASVVLLEEAEESARALYSSWPDRIPALESWLKRYAEPVKMGILSLRDTIESLEKRARPPSREEHERDRTTHPRFEELRRLRTRWRSYQRIAAIRAGEIDVVEPELTREQRSLSAEEMILLAGPMVRGDDPLQRGQDELGLALARVAHDKGQSPATAMLLAYALLANGSFEGVLDSCDRVWREWRQREEEERTALLGSSTPEAHERDVAKSLRLEFEDRIFMDDLRADVEAWVNGERFQQIPQLETEIRTLEAQVDRRRSWSFDDPAMSMLHRTLSQALQRSESFANGDLRNVERRLRWARHIDRATMEGSEISARWAEARQAIAQADGVVASERYALVPIELKAQLGLVPLGMNPNTQLWEFYHPRSAWRSFLDEDPAAIPLPTRGPDGEIAATEGLGIVFVLVPGGTDRLGMQDEAEARQLRDPEPPIPHDVSLSPYFLAKHELTQGQWECLSNGARPSFHRLDGRFLGIPEPVTKRYPVESVSWKDATELLAHHGLALPSEAQWEYACRAGTDTPWFSGNKPWDLAGYANVVDARTRRYYPEWGHEELGFDDGYAGPAPVGSYRPNAWGLYDMAGNIRELCQDVYAPYEIPPRVGDGLRQTKIFENRRVIRGGAFSLMSYLARSAFRAWEDWERRSPSVGIRVARILP